MPHLSITPARRTAPRASTGAAGATAHGAGLLARPAAAAEHGRTAGPQCESRGPCPTNPGHRSYRGRRARPRTRRGHRGGEVASRADLASPAQQIAVAERVLLPQGVGAWPVCGKQRRRGSPPAAAAAPAPAAAAAAAPAPSSGGTYAVRAGDTLGRI